MLPLKHIQVIPTGVGTPNTDGGNWFVLAITENGNLIRGIPKSVPGGKLAIAWDHVQDTAE